MLLPLLAVSICLLGAWQGAPVRTFLLIPMDGRVHAGPHATLHLTSPNDGVLFDLDGDGTPERTAWTAAGSRLAFLAIDRNDNGRIDNGGELIGGYSEPKTANAIEALQTMNRALRKDGQEVASINAEEPLYGELWLWEDANHNGVSERSELQRPNTLSDIGLGYQFQRQTDSHGNEVRLRSWARVRTAPGRNESTSARDNQARSFDTYEVIFRTLPR